MSYSIILNNTRSLSTQYQSDINHKSNESLQAQDQLRRLNPEERKLLVKIIKHANDNSVSIPAEDSPEVKRLADRIIAIQDPNYQPLRSNNPLSKVSKNLKNKWSKTTTDHIFREARKLAPARPKYDPPLSLPPTDLPPVCPKVRPLPDPPIHK